MKIKDGQLCISFTTPTFWTRWVRSYSVSAAAYDSDSTFPTNVIFLRLESTNSELLKELAK